MRNDVQVLQIFPVVDTLSRLITRVHGVDCVQVVVIHDLCIVVPRNVMSIDNMNAQNDSEQQGEQLCDLIN